MKRIKIIKDSDPLVVETKANAFLDEKQNNGAKVFEMRYFHERHKNGTYRSVFYCSYDTDWNDYKGGSDDRG